MTWAQNDPVSFSRDSTATGVRGPVPEPTAPAGLRIAVSPGRGRGVFATRTFEIGDLIERAAAIPFARELVAPLRATLLDDYWFWWDDAHNAVVLGCGTLYNHACPANARYATEAVTRDGLTPAIYLSRRAHQLFQRHGLFLPAPQFIAHCDTERIKCVKIGSKVRPTLELGGNVVVEVVTQILRTQNERRTIRSHQMDYA